MKNCDNKAIGIAQNNCIKYELHRTLHKMQNGFTVLRQFTNNIVDLDAAARKFGCSSRASELPLIALWDFATAFPSLAHAVKVVIFLLRLRHIVT